MKTVLLLEKHRRAVELLEAVMEMEHRKQNRIDDINGIPGTFPSLRAKLKNRVDTINRVIVRLENRYFKTAIEIQEQQDGKARDNEFDEYDKALAYIMENPERYAKAKFAYSMQQAIGRPLTPELTKLVEQYKLFIPQNLR